MITEHISVRTPLGDIVTTLQRTNSSTHMLALLCPGFLDSKDYRHLSDLSKKLAIRGYVVVRFDPIGTWESTGDIANYTMTQYLTDIRSVLSYYTELQAFDSILLGGHSRGGQMALLYAARNQSIDMVVAIMPSAGPIDGDRRTKWKKQGYSENTRDLPSDRKKHRTYRVPYTHVLDRDTYDVYRDVVRISNPTLFILGEEDTVVPPATVEKLYECATQPKKLIRMTSIGHDYRHNAQEVEIVNSRILCHINQ